MSHRALWCLMHNGPCLQPIKWSPKRSTSWWQLQKKGAVSENTSIPNQRWRATTNSVEGIASSSWGEGKICSQAQTYPEGSEWANKQTCSWILYWDRILEWVRSSRVRSSRLDCKMVWVVEENRKAEDVDNQRKALWALIIFSTDIKSFSKSNLSS